MASTAITLPKDVSIKKMVLGTAALGSAMLLGFGIGSMANSMPNPERTQLSEQAPQQMPQGDAAQNPEEQARQKALQQLAMTMNRLPIPAPTPQDAKRTETATAMDPQDMQKLAGKAAEAIRLGDIASARLVLEHAVRAGDATALYALAETYDPRVLVKLRVQGMQGEPETARQLYQQALARGVEEARARL